MTGANGNILISAFVFASVLLLIYLLFLWLCFCTYKAVVKSNSPLGTVEYQATLALYPGKIWIRGYAVILFFMLLSFFCVLRMKNRHIVCLFQWLHGSAAKLSTQSCSRVHVASVSRGVFGWWGILQLSPHLCDNSKYW